MSISVQNLNYEAPGKKGVRILNNINITIETGRITLIVGRTGSGKSSLLNILAGLKVPKEGQVYFGDIPLWQKGIPCISLVRKIGLVFQYPEHQFFLPTVKEEFLYSLKSSKLDSTKREQIVKDTALFCGLGEDILERSPFFLSGGEKRKAALASVLAAQPQWLFMDEPSSGLDSKVGAWLVERLQIMKRQKSEDGGIVIVTHDLDLFLPIADSVIILKDGKVVGNRTPEELVKNYNILEEAGVLIPASLKLASLLSISGFKFEENENMPSLKAVDIADRLTECIRSGNLPETSLTINAKEFTQVQIYNTSKMILKEGQDIEKIENPFTILDPRSKWFFYVIFSLTIFLQPSWLSVGLGMLIVLILAGISRIPIAKFKPLIPMGAFILISFVISGLQLSITLHPFSMAGTHFLLTSAMATLGRLVPLLPVMGGGAIFAYSTSPISMKKGLEAILKKIPGFEKGAEVIALATSLMFRFIKLIPAEIERFSLLASTRGKKGGKPGKLQIRQLPAFFTPMLLSIMQYAEDISIAMEARGYGKAGVRQTNANPLQWQRIDWVVCIIGICVSGLILVIGRL